MPLERLARHERLNFLLTNRIPRRWATLFVGRLSRVENRLVKGAALSLWRLFAGDFSLHEAKDTRFRSLHAVFTRELKPGARPIDSDPDTLVSPCDGIVGAHGCVRGTEVVQAKGFPYTLEELLHDAALVDRYRDGVYVTLRLKSNMYHRFHAPAAGRVREVTYISGDTWNVNPIALERIERLYCKNERAVLDLALAPPHDPIALVAVAAILVASMRFRFLDAPLDLRYRGPNRLACDHGFERGDELGMFEHGSTLIVFAPRGYRLAAGVTAGATLRMGRALLTRS